MQEDKPLNSENDKGLTSGTARVLLTSKSLRRGWSTGAASQISDCLAICVWSPQQFLKRRDTVT